VAQDVRIAIFDIVRRSESEALDVKSMTEKIEVWDLPLRLFHWSLVAAVVAAFASGEAGGKWMDWHGSLGNVVLGLLVFRVVWGFAGTTHARFQDFFPTPKRLVDYLEGSWQGIGHNPAGALSVIALLLLAGALVGTGLFANDDIAFQGPLYGLISKELSDSLSGWHGLLFNVLAGLVVLHIGAIAFYLRVKKINLVRPMLTGKKSVPIHLVTSNEGGGGLRFISAIVVSCTIVLGILELGKTPSEPPAASSTARTPGW
jgi:cytochrome b